MAEEKIFNENEINKSEPWSPEPVEIEYAELPFAINEEMKTLRTNIQFCGKDKKVILLTSAMQNEGKTTLAVNLCRSFSELDKKVLLIDADMRKSIMKKRLKSGKITKGLSHLLSGQAELRDVFYKDKNTGVYLIPSGEYPPNSVELLAGEDMQRLIRAVREMFDYVIIDSAPLGVVTDAAVLATLCDGAVIILNTGKVHYKLVQQVVKKLQNTGCTILGVVLNQLNHQSNGRYYGKKYGYYRRYGRYGYYYRRYANYYYYNYYEHESSKKDSRGSKLKHKKSSEKNNEKRG